MGLAEFVPPICQFDFNGFEMPFPRFRPVLAPDFGHGDCAGADFQPAFLDPLQSGGDFITDSRNRPLFAKGGNRAHTGFYMKIRRSGAVQDRAQRFGNGVLGFTRRGDGNPPEHFVFHLSVGRESSRAAINLQVRARQSLAPPIGFHNKSRHGVKLSNSTSAMCGCNATRVTLAYSISNWLVFGSGKSRRMASIMRITPP